MVYVVIANWLRDPSIIISSANIWLSDLIYSKFKLNLIFSLEVDGKRLAIKIWLKPSLWRVVMQKSLEIEIIQVLSTEQVELLVE